MITTVWCIITGCEFWSPLSPLIISLLARAGWGRVWLVIMDGEGEWRQVKVCQQTGERRAVSWHRSNWWGDQHWQHNTQTPGRWRERHRSWASQSWAQSTPSFASMTILIIQRSRIAAVFFSDDVWIVWPCQETVGTVVLAVMLPSVTSALFISPCSPPQSKVTRLQVGSLKDKSVHKDSDEHGMSSIHLMTPNLWGCPR